jgi:hypothetical protein
VLVFDLGQQVIQCQIAKKLLTFLGVVAISFFVQRQNTQDGLSFKNNADLRFTIQRALQTAGIEAVVCKETQEAARCIATDDTLSRKPDLRGRMVVGLFTQQDDISANDVPRLLGLSPRQA